MNLIEKVNDSNTSDDFKIQDNNDTNLVKEDLSSDSRQNQSNIVDKLIEKNEKILNLPINIAVELGGLKVKIKDLLNFSVGTMLSLNESPEDFLKIFANGKLIGLGEIVVSQKKYGIRIISMKKNLNSVNNQ
ncbi:flagellar motor switch protein FliN [Buchnera aphidicola (Melanaphis sacchari)]|uniref:Flagellar motor switch protein FliN n=1 Tax=Buchnera aphidicola (Melanaphis sacchari) TaxID=2173854 RepID=A0A2U8DGR7_9GAMM|nr:FliM/FliN family flagellar motor switch protein [Buchnera aphidicola]AWH90681.1 flagellar motor switch protein FliN [Buchnera aphidicola (Melanaphis sacchari)]